MRRPSPEGVTYAGAAGRPATRAPHEKNPPRSPRAWLCAVGCNACRSAPGVRRNARRGDKAASGRARYTATDCRQRAERETRGRAAEAVWRKRPAVRGAGLQAESSRAPRSAEDAAGRHPRALHGTRRRRRTRRGLAAGGARTRPTARTGKEHVLLCVLTGSNRNEIKLREI